MPLYSVAMPGVAVAKRVFPGADQIQYITNAYQAEGDSFLVIFASFSVEGDTLQEIFVSPLYSTAMPGVGVGRRVFPGADTKQIITVITVEILGDTKQVISADHQAEADLLQIISALVQWAADTRQIITSPHQNQADTKQIITSAHQTNGDTGQIIHVHYVAQGDLEQIIHVPVEALADVLAKLRNAFWFRGENLYDHGGSLLIDSLFDGTPEANEVTLDVPGRPGALYFSTEDGERVIRLRLGFSVPVSHQEKMRELAAWLNPRAGECELKFDAEPDKVYFMRVARKWQMPGRPLWVVFDVEFRGSDPYAYGRQQNYSASGASPLALALDNPGTMETPLIITLTPAAGQITNVSLALGTQAMNVSGPFTQALVIDTAKMTAVTGGANAAGQIGGDWLSLAPGISNLNVSWTGGEMTVNVSYRPRWR